MMLIKTTTVFEREEQAIFGKLNKWTHLLEKIEKWAITVDQLKFAKHLAHNEHVNWDHNNLFLALLPWKKVLNMTKQNIEDLQYELDRSQNIEENSIKSVGHYKIETKTKIPIISNANQVTKTLIESAETAVAEINKAINLGLMIIETMKGVSPILVDVYDEDEQWFYVYTMRNDND